MNSWNSNLVSVDRTIGSVTVWVEVDIDAAVKQQLYDLVCLELNQRSDLHIRLDRVDFMDSAGLWLLLAIRAECRRLGIPVSFENPSRSVARVIEITGLQLLLLEPIPPVDQPPTA